VLFHSREVDDIGGKKRRGVYIYIKIKFDFNLEMDKIVPFKKIIENN